MLFQFGQSRKTDLNNYLQTKKGFNFTDLNRPLVGFVRRLVAYKEQRIIFSLIPWIVAIGQRLWHSNFFGETRRAWHEPSHRRRWPGYGWKKLVEGFKAMEQWEELKNKFIFIDGSGTEIMKLATQASDVG